MLVCAWSLLLRRLRQEDCWSPGVQGCNELQLYPCTPAWVARARPCHTHTQRMLLWL
uniref:Macaca fascicularis brain cDNA clone: QtrA-15516, similar to human Fas apoptotic inhibitory molecule (FAIM), mRNA, RefSeq: NM_018147.1 n=1 Tax=Macaca fascicularis TaxID=9541 RepID=I7GJ94_MACFA|nr:unnamed protein product [Macaca fascicularis]